MKNNNMLISRKYQIFPTEEQINIMNDIMNACRFTYNQVLEYAIKQYKENKKSFNVYDCIKYVNTLKDKYEFLNNKNIDSIALRQIIKINLNNAFKTFFRNTKKNGFPHFKSKKDIKNYSYRTCNVNNNIHFNKDDDNNITISIPKLKNIKIVDSFDEFKYDNNIKFLTLKKNNLNEYYISITYEIDKQEYYKENKKNISYDNIIGLDMRVKNTITYSNGKVFNITNTRTNRINEHIKQIQSILSRKTRGSINYNETLYHKHKLQKRINNIKKDLINKEVHNLTKNYDVICIEDLNVNSMVIHDKHDKKSRNINRSIYNNNISMFINTLHNSCNKYNVTLITCDKYYPSTQMCSNCKDINDNLINNLNIRKWTCPKCNTKHDRDINAAINIKDYGYNYLLNLINDDNI